MNVVLMGSVSSSWHALDALVRGGVTVTGVLGVHESQADRIGDFRSLRERAGDAGIPFHAFVKVGESAVASFIESKSPDMLWVIGLSQLVPDRLIRLANHGGVGFHPTMLPEGRGRAPVAWTILLNARAAATLFYLCDEPDAGDIIVQREVPVKPDDYSEDLIHRTNLVLGEAVLELAPRLQSNDLPRTPQDHSKATFYKKRTPADGLIDWSASTDCVYRLIRAAGRPYPGAFTYIAERKLTVWRAQPADDSSVDHDADAGRVIAIDQAQGVLVATADAGVWLTEVDVQHGGSACDVLAVGDRLMSDARSPKR